MSIIRKLPLVGLIMVLSHECQGISMKYKSDDMDDLLEGVITNKHKDQQ